MVTAKWLQQRHEYGAVLQMHAEARASKAVAAMWDRYVRQTSRMQVIDEQLRSALPSGFTVMTGERLGYKGHEIYLEHLVIGSTGLFLVEVREGDDESWQQDLARNIAFCRESLGANAGFFNCLVIERTLSEPVMPAGATLVPSVEVALDIIRTERFGVELTPVMVEEVRHLVEAVRIATPPEPPTLTLKQHLHWRELFTLPNLPWACCAILLAIIYLWSPLVLTGAVVYFGGGIWIALRLIKRNPDKQKREANMKVLLGFLLFLIIGFAMVLAMVPPPLSPARNG